MAFCACVNILFCPVLDGSTHPKSVGSKIPDVAVGSGAPVETAPELSPVSSTTSPVSLVKLGSSSFNRIALGFLHFVKNRSFKISFALGLLDGSF